MAIFKHLSTNGSSIPTRNLLAGSLGLVFIAGIILVSLNLFWPVLVMVVLLSMLAVWKSRVRPVAALIAAFLLGFLLYKLWGNQLRLSSVTSQWRILGDRLGLLIIIFSLALAARSNASRIFPYLAKANWQAVIRPAWSQAASGSIPIHRFFVIALASNIGVFVSLIFLRGQLPSPELVLFGLVFALVNGGLEELLWRSQLLGGLQKGLGDFWAMLLTSLGFGLQHLALGFGLPIALAFTVGGSCFGLITLKTKSLWPSLVLHAVINLGMVLAGFII